jgi:2-polyprenyl-3-methyl-5-hydroxy-6-metoxy-1,4-benzoquinol methylase
MKGISQKMSTDIHGNTTLDKLSKATHFNKWIYQSIKPWMNGAILEIGSGIGTISSLLVDDGFQIMITEIDETYLEILDDKFKGLDSVFDVLRLNLVDSDFDRKFQHMFQTFDTVIAINVMEHIEDDLTAIQNAQKLVKKEGSLIVLVPNSEFLYNGLDRNLSHFRRYNKNKIGNLFHAAGLLPERFFYFNAIGVVGWIFSSGILRNKTIPSSMISIFEFLIPLTSWLDVLFKNRFGLSIIAIGKKIS